MAFEIDKIASLQIGVQGENIARSIPIDMTKWVEELDADGIEGYAFHVLFQPYNDPNVYPMVSYYDAETMTLTWKITAEATLTPGVGYAEIRAQEETSGLVKKTRIIPTSVEKSISGIESDPPEVQEAWVTIVLNARTAAEAAALEAEEWATNAKKIIIISDTQPVDEPYNKLWIKDQAEQEYTVPLYSEFETLAADVEEKYEKPLGGIPASDLADDVIPDVSGFYTKPAGGIPESDIASGVIPDVSGFYTKPAGGIPASDIASGVIPDTSGFYTKPASGIPATDLANGVIPDVSGFYTKPVNGIPISDLGPDVTLSINSKIEEPDNEGISGQVLTTDGNGGRRWTTVQGGGGTSDYTDLTNKPQIAGVTLSGNKSLSDLGIAAESDIPDVSGFYTKPVNGIPASDLASGVIPDISGKADKVSSATNNNFAALDSSGNLKDSGHKHSDYLTQHQDISGKIDKPSNPATGAFLTYNGSAWVAQTLSTWQGGNY